MFLVSIANNIPTIQILKNVCNDKRYYYSKSNGLLKQVFSNQYYDETLFLKLDIESAINYIINNFDEIIKKERKLFNSKKKKSEKEMLENRKKYIEKNIIS